VEEAAVGAVKVVEAVEGVFGGVRVHHVQQNVDSVLVRHVDQLFELVGSPVPTEKITEPYFYL